MKRQQLTQIKGLDLKELGEKAKVLKTEIADALMDKNMKKLKDLKVIRNKRRDLAQVLTVARQKEMLQQLEATRPSSGGKQK